MTKVILGKSFLQYRKEIAEHIRYTDYFIPAAPGMAISSTRRAENPGSR
jgi:hypothetical protein